MRVLVTGATGYIGGRLVPRLLERGHRVRVLVRDPRRIAGPAVARAGRGGHRRPGDGRGLERGSGRHRRRVLPGPLHDLGRRLRRARPPGGTGVRGCRGGPAPRRLPGGSGPRGPRLPTPGEPRRGGRDPPGRPAGHGVPGRAGDRLRLRLVRDGALPHRAAPRDGHPALDLQPGVAGGGRRRPGLPRGRDRARPQRHRRDRRRRAHLQADDAGVRGGARPAAPHLRDPGAGTAPGGPLGGAGDTHPQPAGSAPHRGGEPPDRRRHHPCPGALPAHHPAALPPRRGAGPRGRGPQRGGDPLERRPGLRRDGRALRSRRTHPRGADAPRGRDARVGVRRRSRAWVATAAG